MTVKQRSWKTLYEPKFGRPVKITVWKNNDFESPGQEVTLNAKYMRSWNSVLNFLTIMLQPRFGAVRKIYCLDTKNVVHCLHEIKMNERYVAGGAEKFKFKKDGYLTEQEKLTQLGSKPAANMDKTNQTISLDSFMAYTKKKNRTVVYFMVSGRTCQVPVKVVLIESDLLHYSMILEYLSYRLDVAEGIKYLCNVKGRRILNPSKLKHGELYIAIPFPEKFQRLNYKKLFTELLPPRLVPSQPKSAKNKKRNGKIDEKNFKDSEAGSNQNIEQGLFEDHLDNPLPKFYPELQTDDNGVLTNPEQSSDTNSANSSQAMLALEQQEQVNEADLVGCIDTPMLPDLPTIDQEATATSNALSTPPKKSSNSYSASSAPEMLLPEQDEKLSEANLGQASINGGTNQLRKSNNFHSVPATSPQVALPSKQNGKSSETNAGDISEDNGSTSPTIMEKPRPDLITFADIARNKKSEMEAESVCMLDLLKGPEPTISISSTKKAVVFSRTLTPVIPDTIFESPESNLHSPDIRSSTSLELCPIASILKVKKDSSISTDLNQHDICILPTLNPVKARNSIIFGQEGGAKCLEHDIIQEHESSDDSLNRSNNSSDKEKSNLPLHDKTISRGVQKNWNADEDIAEKSIQANTETKADDTNSKKLEDHCKIPFYINNGIKKRNCVSSMGKITYVKRSTAACCKIHQEKVEVRDVDMQVPESLSISSLMKDISDICEHFDQESTCPPFCSIDSSKTSNGAGCSKTEKEPSGCYSPETCCQKQETEDKNHEKPQ